MLNSMSGNMDGQSIYRALSYDALSEEHRERLAQLYTEIGIVFRDAGITTLERIAALQAAWFRNDLSSFVAPKGTP